MSENDATRQVSMWITNDGEHYPVARAYALVGVPEHLADFLKDVLDCAPEQSAAWHTRRHLSAVDLEDNVDWQSVLDDLKGE